MLTNIKMSTNHKITVRRTPFFTAAGLLVGSRGGRYGASTSISVISLTCFHERGGPQSMKL